MRTHLKQRVTITAYMAARNAIRSGIRLLLLVCLPTLAAAQDEEETFSPERLEGIARNMKPVWEDKDPDLTIQLVPEKWQQESGVILAQKTRFSFDKDANKLAVYEITRRRIWLNDRDAIHAFSAVFFRIGSPNDAAGIRILKTNGTVVNVSLRNAIYVEDPSEVPTTYQPYIGKASTYKDKSRSRVLFYKVAIPDLAPGDIIDYATIFYDDNTVKKMSFYEFEPIYYVCAREYPVVSQKFIIDTDANSFVNSKATMGAPDFRETGNPEADYSWEDRNREKIRDSRWVNSLIDLPVVKFQIVFSRTENREDLFIGERGALKQALPPAELANKMNRLYERLDGSMYHAMAKNYLRQIGYSNLSEEEFIQKTYYILRHLSHFIADGFSSELFASCLMQCLDLKKIPYQLVVTTPMNLTRLEHILFRSEPECLVRVRDRYICNATVFSNPFDLREEFLGAPAYVITRGRNPTATPVTLPGTQADDHVATFTTEATLDTATRDLVVTQQRAITGLSKKWYNKEALTHTSALDDDHRSYGGEDDIRAQLRGDALQRFEEKQRERKKEDPARKRSFMEEVLLQDYVNLSEYQEFTLNSDGRTWRKQELNYTNRFLLSDMVKGAGGNLLIPVPALMGEPLFLSMEERQRDRDAWLGFPRGQRHIIRFIIPQGYRAVGVSNLNVNLTNETGTFAVQASVEGQVLTLLVKKVYKQAVVKKEEWPAFVTLLDAAFMFTQRKVLLKKQ